MRTYIGIDPGASGFISVIYPNGVKDFFSIKENDTRDVVEFLRGVKDQSQGDCICCMEEVHAVFGSSARGTFAFGKVCGLLEGMLVSLCIPYHLVQPKEWQGEIWINQDKEYTVKTKSWKDKNGIERVKSVRKVDTKKTSLNAGKRLFPNVDFKRSDKCKIEDDNKCDSLLICEFGRRLNL